MTRAGWRLLSAIPTLLGVILLTFLLTRVLPGDPAAFFAANPAMSAADIAALRQELGLDEPLWSQFLIYLRGLAQADLGQSVSTGTSVAAELASRLPATAELVLPAFALACTLAVPLGVLAALRPGSLPDHLARLLAGAGVAVPGFVAALLLIYVFYVRLDWAPEPIGRLDVFLTPPVRVTGFYTLDAVLAGDLPLLRAVLAQMVLPVLSMSLFAFGPLLRMTRASMRDVLGAEFIRAARAAGLGARQIVVTYALRNAMLPVVVAMGMVLSYMLGASVLIEQVFSWPGIGAFAIGSVMALDYAPLQGFVLVMAALLIAINLLTDLLAALIDPRLSDPGSGR